MHNPRQTRGDGDGLSRTILAAWRSLLARWKRRDLGVDRSELRSIAAEIAGGAQPTPVITRYY